MNDGMYMNVVDAFGHQLGSLVIPWEDFYWIRQTFICEIQYGLIVIY